MRASLGGRRKERPTARPLDDARGPHPITREMRDDEARYNPLRRDFSRRDAPDDDDDDDLEDDDGAEEEEEDEEDEEDEELDLVAEAHRARLARLFHRRECETRARAELRALDAIRRARETRAALDVETESARARLEREHAFTWADDATVRAAERAAERAAASWARRWTRRTRGSARVHHPAATVVPATERSPVRTLRRRHTPRRRHVGATRRRVGGFEARAARAANGDGGARRGRRRAVAPDERPADALSALAAIEAARARGGVRTGDIGDARGSSPPRTDARSGGYPCGGTRQVPRPIGAALRTDGEEARGTGFSRERRTPTRSRDGCATWRRE